MGCEGTSAMALDTRLGYSRCGGECDAARFERKTCVRCEVACVVRGKVRGTTRSGRTAKKKMGKEERCSMGSGACRGAAGVGRHGVRWQAAVALPLALANDTVRLLGSTCAPCRSFGALRRLLLCFLLVWLRFSNLTTSGCTHVRPSLVCSRGTKRPETWCNSGETRVVYLTYRLNRVRLSCI